MICDPIKLASREGLRPQSYVILAKQAHHLTVKMETVQGTVLFKADATPNDTTWDVINIGWLKSGGLPVPTVIAQGETPVSYVILDWIDGEPLSSASPMAAQLEAGRLLHRIHHLKDRPPYKRAYSWDAWMEGWLNVALPWWGAQRGVEASAVDAAWRGFEALRPLLATRGTHFMLQDGRPEHFIVRDGRVVGLIDLHDAQAGDAGMDLGVIAVSDPALLTNMRKAYATDSAEKAALHELIPFYIFLRHLAAAEWHSKFGSATLSQRSLAMAIANPLGG